MEIITGPVLYFRGLDNHRCRMAALVVLPHDHTPPPLQPEAGEPVAPRELARGPGLIAWSYEFTLPAGRAGRYTLGERTWPVHPPGGGPLRIAYTACNGSEQDRPGPVAPERNERWRHLAGEHAQSPYQLLIQGGDQVYADALWEEVPELHRWRRLPWRRQLQAEFTPAMAQGVADFYFRHYCWLWSQPDLAPLLASIPSLMMWDDHDIFDGWGSHPPQQQACAVFQGIWQAARNRFALFQLGSHPDSLPDGFGDPRGGHFGCVYRVGGTAILAPDLRSERSRRQVMGKKGWQWLEQTLEELQDCRRLLLVSTVPVINLDLSFVERLLRLLPVHAFYKDDLRDQWRSYAHRGEWRRLVTRLLDYSAESGAPVTVLSGEIHLGALGEVVRDDGTRFHQLTASGVVHPPPPAPLVRAYDWLSRKPVEVEPGTEMTLQPLPELQQRYLAARNWLSLEVRPEGGLEARWYPENRSRPLTLILP